MKIIKYLLPAFACIALISACQNSPASGLTNKTNTTASLNKVGNAFWETLSNNCGKTFSGYSSFPDDPEDSFHGKLLVAHIETCLDNEIIVPFKVGDNTSRTWIFTRTSEHVQLKHQHLHKDGTPDEISNYGGIAISGDSALVQAASHTELSQISLAFPADSYTRELLPEAATNVWNITLLSDPENGYGGIVYYLTRHDKPRFKALLTLDPE